MKTHRVITVDNPVVRDHRVLGQHLLPGLAYIDLLYQIFRKQGYDYQSLELRNLSIYQPLIVARDASVELDIECLETQAGRWIIAVEGRQEGGGERKRHATAEMRLAESPRFTAIMDLAELKRATERVLDLESIYSACRQLELLHDEFMQARGTLYVTDDAVVVDCRLSAAASSSAKHLMFHPALIDGSAVCGGGIALSWLFRDVDRQLLLPLSYASFRASALLQDSCIVRIRRNAIRSVNDLVQYTLEFFDASGRQIAELADLSSKSVRDPAHIDTQRAIDGSPRSAGIRAAAEAPPQPVVQESATHVQSELERLLRGLVAAKLGRPVEKIDSTAGYYELGIDSAAMLELVRTLEQHLGMELPPTLLFEYVTIAQLAAYLAGSGARAVPESDERPEPTARPRRSDFTSRTYVFRHEEAYLRDHLVFGVPAVMGVTHPALALETYVRSSHAEFPIELMNVRFRGGPINVTEGASAAVTVNIERGSKHNPFKVSYRTSDDPAPKPCCDGDHIGGTIAAAQTIDLAQLLSRARPLPTTMVEALYRRTQDFAIGPLLRTIQGISIVDAATQILEVGFLAEHSKGSVSSYLIDPIALCSCYYLSLEEGLEAPSERMFIPLAIQRLVVHRQVPDRFYAVITVRVKRHDYVAFDAKLVDAAGVVVATIDNASIKEVTNPALLINATVESKASRVGRAQADRMPSDIAIIGMSGRFPQSPSLDAYWENLKSGKDCITEIPRERWEHAEYFDPVRGTPGKTYSKWGGFIDGVDEFDPLFFSISPREAQFMDPQERLFLQCVYQTIEDAGYTREGLRGERSDGAIGVFVGVMYEEYQLYAAQAQARGHASILGASPASIANRVSYFCDFNGPSLAVDTMCSSSLTAIHLACESLQHGGCHVAIAGGVNLSIHPNKYLVLAQGQFASSNGRCVSFGENGDGYVPGEGVGAVLLKPLAQAIADRDHIYGVIKATSVNHGGKTNGYTVPHPTAQSQVIARALEAARVDARSISYIEAHGTGTSLGDPIEIAGLAQAFAKCTQARQYCAIGSVKSNIGHLEGAAGIAALAKVLLQLQHGMLVPSLHSRQLNPHIDFTRTPFFVQQVLAPWERPVLEADGRSEVHPRIAGISSFGAGGANAHIIVAEHIEAELAEPATPAVLTDPALIVLSAKDGERLREQAQRLLQHLATDAAQTMSLADLAYTLQVGREAMEYRFACIAATVDALRNKLVTFVETEAQPRSAAGFYYGRTTRDNDAVTLFSADEELQEAIDKWVQRGKFAKLLELWVQGLAFDWNRLYADTKPRRVSLPTYPFARERYWIPKEHLSPCETRTASSVVTHGLHPLLHTNVSDFLEQRYTTTLTGKEFFLADHVVQGQRVLPGVAHLAMAHEAAVRASGMRPRDNIERTATSIRLENIIWARPLVVGDSPLTVQIRLIPETDDELAYEIYSIAETRPGEGSIETIYSKGRGVATSPGDSKSVDLERLRARCERVVLTSERCYQIYDALGIHYGPAHRGVASISLGANTDGSPFLLAHIDLPASIAETYDQYLLHPSVLDSALHAAIGLTPEIEHLELASDQIKLQLPFALDSLQILRVCPASPYVYIRPAAGAHGKVQKFDVDLLDEHGAICIELRGLASRSYDGEVRSRHESDGQHELMTFEEHWRAEPLSLVPGEQLDTLVCVLAQSDAAFETQFRETLDRLDPRVRAVILAPGPKSSEHESSRYAVDATDPRTYAAAIDAITKKHGVIGAVLSLQGVQTPKGVDSGHGDMVTLVQAVAQAQVPPIRLMFAGLYENEQGRSRLESWMSLTPSLKPILQRTTVSVIGMSTPAQLQTNTVETWLPTLLAELVQGGSQNVIHCNGERLMSHLQRTSVLPAKSVLRRNGTYLITGGAGGLGLLFAGYLTEQYAANVILTGRSELGAAKRERLRSLEIEGAQVMYARVDIADRERMQAVVDDARARFGRIDGVIHAAGISPTGSVLEVSPAAFEKIVSPKINGTLVLDDVFAADEPDFICYFSSSSAVLGDFGSASYAIGNRFQMAYARQRGNARAATCKVLAISWPLWADGGLGIGDENATSLYLRRTGQSALTAAEGLDLFERLLAGTPNQLLVMSGIPDRVHRLLGVHAAAPKSTVEHSARAEHKREAMQPLGIVETAGEITLEAKARAYLKQMLACTLNLSVARMEDDEPLEKYGVDSITVMQVTSLLEKTFGSLSKTLMFEFQSVGALAGYFIENHRDALLAELNKTGTATPVATAPVATATAPVALTHSMETRRMSRFLNRAKQPRANETASGHAACDIAIIGLSARYPQSIDLDQFWANLKSGRDCITEIPAERWNHAGYLAREELALPRSQASWGGFLADLDAFDHRSFDIKDSEVGSMDRHEKLFLQMVAQLMDHAGYTAQRIKTQHQGKIGVYVGASAMAGSSTGMLASRATSFLGLKGPSLVVDSYSASATTALHLACQALTHGDCEGAIVGGVHLLSPEVFYSLGRWQPDGMQAHCRGFSNAGGMVSAEGAGAVFLKPLRDAIRDNDRVLAVVKSTALTTGGDMMNFPPDPLRVAEVIKASLSKAGVDARELGYVEPMATGVPTIDYCEFVGYANAFREHTVDKGFCAMGTVESNIGHPIAACGIAQLIKVVLQVHFGQLVPTIKADPLNPQLDFVDSPFYLQRSLADWPKPASNVPRRALYTTRGASGTIGAVVIEEHVPIAEADVRFIRRSAQGMIGGSRVGITG